MLYLPGVNISQACCEWALTNWQAPWIPLARRRGGTAAAEAEMNSYRGGAACSVTVGTSSQRYEARASGAGRKARQKL